MTENKSAPEVPTEEPEEEGLSPEEAYRHLAGMSPEPVVEPEEN